MGQRQGGQEVEDRNERQAKVIAFVGGFPRERQGWAAATARIRSSKMSGTSPAVTEAEHCGLLGLGPKCSWSGSGSLRWQIICMLPRPLLLLRIG